MEQLWRQLTEGSVMDRVAALAKRPSTTVDSILSVIQQQYYGGSE